MLRQDTAGLATHPSSWSIEIVSVRVKVIYVYGWLRDKASQCILPGQSMLWEEFGRALGQALGDTLV